MLERKTSRTLLYRGAMTIVGDPEARVLKEADRTSLKDLLGHRCGQADAYRRGGGVKIDAARGSPTMDPVDVGQFRVVAVVDVVSDIGKRVVERDVVEE